MSKPTKPIRTSGFIQEPGKSSEPPKAIKRQARGSRLEALERLRKELSDGKTPINQLFTVRTLRLDVGPESFDADAVRAVREAIGASQSAFALFLGASPDTVRSWEQGRRSPSGMAARFLEEIRRNPGYFKDRMAEAISRS